MNREKYSEPEDVLFDEDGRYDGFGVLEFAVRDIPTRLSTDEVLVFLFFPKHVPEVKNYAHSELWCDREPPTGDYAEPSDIAKKQFRAKLSQRVSIRIEARK